MILDRFGEGWVINLPERSDRRRDTTREFSRIGYSNYQFYDAIRPSDAGDFYSIGARGAYHSHLNVLKRGIGKKAILVMEDDVQFSSDFSIRADILDKIPETWDVCYLGFMQLPEVYREISGTGVVRVGPEFHFIGLHCYAVSGKAIARVTSAFEAYLSRAVDDPEGGPMPIDGALNIARGQLGLETYVINPPLAIQRASRTDVGQQRWFDKVPVLRATAGWARQLKNAIRSHRGPA